MRVRYIQGQRKIRAETVFKDFKDCRNQGRNLAEAIDQVVSK